MHLSFFILLDFVVFRVRKIINFVLMKNKLLHTIEVHTGLTMRHNNDFKQLSEFIFTETHEHISTTTLKRLWGYVSDQDCQPRHTTLDLLAKYLGYSSFAQFCEWGG